MESIKKNLGSRFCHRCDYCQPCTAGIAISTVMSIRTFFKRMPPERVFEERTNQLIEKVSECKDCGECEKRCPYHLPIRETISENASLFLSEKKKFLETQKR
jgi:hypothetical protein